MFLVIQKLFDHIFRWKVGFFQGPSANFDLSSMSLELPQVVVIGALSFQEGDTYDSDMAFSASRTFQGHHIWNQPYTL